MGISLAEADGMKLGEGQCRNVFRLDKKACRACAGHDKTCPAYSPAEKEREIKDDAGRSDCYFAG